MSVHHFLNLYEPAPWFVCASTSNPKYHFSSLGGLYIVLTFFGNDQHPTSQQVNHAFLANKWLFDDMNACWFGISTQPQSEERLLEQLPGVRYFFDQDQSVSRLYRVISREGLYCPCTYIIDKQLRIVAIIPFIADGMQHVHQVMAKLNHLSQQALLVPAPVLIIPNVFEDSFCQQLIAYYHKKGGEVSGITREENGMTVGRYDNNFKIRKDTVIEEENVKKAINIRINRRLVPEIEKAFRFKATRIERYLVACYDANDGGFFRPHRDDTTKGTAHRCFAVTINLNAEDYEGGDLRFPEFGQQTYRAPTGGAVVFSCSLLHEATRVTKGQRYAVLPFLYNEEAAKIREENAAFIES
ncbi:2OG-Fe(II) oxygenase [Agitococcus lubricus]|uniref:AhpC/TSA family protein n=1 Tax=Agitococcus lubricus TaxID=1077255 RepID=A0A2T5IWH6_9GAMM|nr:2OG-Fe(II) oxygenase [Agitococcus lubricus]PTQ88252.1 AhpC/TSA family protein [Agitococcus lubricus]